MAHTCWRKLLLRLRDQARGEAWSDVAPLVIPVFNAGADAADQGASAIATSEVNVMPEVKRHESIAIWDFQKKDKAAVTS
jgi:hypothetical protein